MSDPIKQALWDEWQRRLAERELWPVERMLAEREAACAWLRERAEWFEQVARDHPPLQAAAMLSVEAARRMMETLR